MGIVFRQSVKTTIVTFAGAILGTFISYAYTYVLSKTQLGFVRNLTIQGVVLQYFVLFGSALMLATFIQRYSANDPRRKVLISIAALVPFITIILITIPYLLLQNKIVGKYHLQDQGYISKYYVLLPILALFLSLSSLVESYLYAELKIAVAVFIKDVLFRILNIVVLVLFFFKLYSFDVFIILSVLCYAVPFILQLAVAKKTEGFGFSFKWDVFSKDEYKEILNFSLYHLLYAIAFHILAYIDQLMLAPLDNDGLKSLAVYTTGTFIISLMIIPYKAMSGPSYTMLNRAYIDRDFAKLRDLYNRSSLNMFIVAMVMFLIIGCNLPNAVHILPKGYEAITPIVFILMIGRLFDMATGINGELISISVYYRFNLWFSIFLLILVFTLNRILIPTHGNSSNLSYSIFYFHGIYGAAWSNTIFLFIYNIIKYAFLWKKMQIQPFSRNTIKIIAIGIIVLGINYYIPYIHNPVFDTMMRTAIIVIIFSGLLFYLKPSEDLEIYFKEVKKNKRLF
jgi:O-antigen/teichoic acid export membrane protein